jgi:hypothetical protein
MPVEFSTLPAGKYTLASKRVFSQHRRMKSAGRAEGLRPWKTSFLPAHD